MSKETKKRTMIYSNVKENKRKAEKATKNDDDQINLDDEFIIGLSKPKIASEVEKKQSKPEKKKKTKKKKSTEKKSIEKNVKKPKKKITKKQLKIRLLIVLILFLSIIIGSVVVILNNLPSFNVSTIEVSIENKKFLTEEDIKVESLITEGDNIFSISRRDVVESIKCNPYVENVKVKKVLPNTIKINVEERSIKFQLEYEGTYINVDSQGYILEQTQERQDVLLISGCSTTDMTRGNRLEEKDLEKLSDILQIMQEAQKQGLDTEVTRIDVKSGSNYIIYLDNCGKSIHFGNANLINDKFAYIKKILEIESEYEGEIIVNVDYNKGEYPYFREKV